jgi:hypothetical protein
MPTQANKTLIKIFADATRVCKFLDVHDIDMAS